MGIWREYHEVGAGGRLKKEWKYRADKFDTVDPILIQERDQQSKIIFQTKEPISQHKPANFPPLNSDDVDSEEDDLPQEEGIVRSHPIFVFKIIPSKNKLAELPFILSAGFICTPLTPPDIPV